MKTIRKAEYDGDNIMTVEYNSGHVERYAGDSTVWHKLPMMKRCNTLTEELLADLWSYWKQWGNPYPTAHIPKEEAAPYSEDIKMEIGAKFVNGDYKDVSGFIEDLNKLIEAVKSE